MNSIISSFIVMIEFLIFMIIIITLIQIYLYLKKLLKYILMKIKESKATK